MIEIAIENETIIKNEKYQNLKGEVKILNFENCKTRFIAPNVNIKPPKDHQETNTVFRLFAKTTVEVALQYKNAMILNFASGRHPGGGYKTGAIAQEESLCRASALHNCLITKEEEFHKPNITSKDPAYTSAIIYSSKVPFFRDQNNQLLDEPCYYDVLSCAAINQSKKPNKDALKLMEERIERILYIAFVAKAKILILGAFGAGIFSNPPEMIADIFYRMLICKFKNVFEEVVFAILPDAKNEDKNYNAFQFQFRKLIQ